MKSITLPRKVERRIAPCMGFHMVEEYRDGVFYTNRGCFKDIKKAEAKRDER